MTNNQLSAYTHKQFFNAPTIQKAFDDVWKGAGTQFAVSILSVLQGSQSLKSASNESIYAAAMKAAVLNLPIEPSLGRAYLVPYKGQAQFQLGYKGLIELAQRSGQYKNINAGIVYKSQLISYNPLFEELILDFSKPQDEIVGYFAAFKLLNGFEKVSFWTVEKVTAHGKKFSKSFASGPWKTDFDAMAQKTILKDILSKYGPLSVEMQKAIEEDNQDSTISTPKDITPQETNSLDDLIDHQSEKKDAPSNLKDASEYLHSEPEKTLTDENKTVLEDTSYPADEVPDFDQETGEVLASEGNLFDNLGDLMP
ncbi:recombinase, phage RecT family protein [Streptococcus pyogenes]|uniref:recombinase RecT n=2 Tax=Streptococcus pyogenes TaxID=1314 RepID=UPI000E042790|nr:recombinase RecT [Streptococcus pyogenes]SUO65225.1 recombinase, phage RecT family protein [Streptococcus pyogenes]VGS65483.1 recombinase, phage RecT family protein [Streptococcus pyogenes]VGT14972.1 recombinase, phage RecT family protein [Streptococcus pyogenes]VGT39692.1 recombinase, phage RecT family protein [Streptococcus pyogenes]VGT48585.1 recombinase, phage RecT family protein [Streptococcus pyogenes]